jgi:hypothetical protein
MSPLAHGSNEPINLYVGNDPVQKIYRGSQQVWPTPPPGTADFKIYSLWGTGDPGPRGGFELLDGATIEMAAPGALSIYIDNETGFSTTDQRRLFYETDYGERYDAQFLTHSHLPVGFTTLDPTGPQLGVYPGFVSGHVFRGVDMSGAQVLNKDYVNPVAGAPVGTMDKTVTFFVSDGLVSKTKTITVRLCDPFHYYQDTTKSTYGVAANVPARMRANENRRGVVYVSRDGDFTGCPSGPNVWKLTLPDGVLTNRTFNIRPDGEPARQLTRNDVPVSDFNWSWVAPFTIALYLKGGETYYTRSGGTTIELLGGINSLITSWGTGRAIIDGVNASTWHPNSGSMLTSNANQMGNQRFVNLDMKASDYDVSQEEWRIWWNELNYTNKTGTITENSQDNVASNPYNGDVLTNGNGVYTQVIRDDDNGDGTGKLIVRQVVNMASVNNPVAEHVPFTDGDTLTGPTGSVTFVAAGSRQDRTRKCLAPGFGWSAEGGLKGTLIDRCIFQGAATAISYPPHWCTISDSAILNYFNYGIFGSAINMVQNALIIAQPSDYEGQNRTMGSAVDPNRGDFNTIMAGLPTTPATNDIAHAAQRYGSITSFAQYKVGQWTYGGHGAAHQPAMRFGTNGSQYFEMQQVYQYGCFLAGGSRVMQITTPPAWSHVSPRTPKAWVLDECWLRGIYCNGGYYAGYVTNIVFRNCRIGHAAGGRFTYGGQPVTFLEFNDKAEVDFTSPPDGPTASAPFVENCLFEFKPDTGTAAAINGFDTDIRGFTVTYSGNTFDIDPSRVLGAIGPFTQD